MFRSMRNIVRHTNNYYKINGEVKNVRRTKIICFIETV